MKKVVPAKWPKKYSWAWKESYKENDNEKKIHATRKFSNPHNFSDDPSPWCENVVL